VKRGLVKKAKKALAALLIRMRESSDKYDRNLIFIEAAKMDLLRRHPDFFTRRGPQ
jgi:hypothetical protein